MCGRYALYAPASRVKDHFEASTGEFPDDLSPRYNAAPMQWLSVVRQRQTGERVVHLLRWGLVPSWSRDESIATKLINARGETLAEKPSFRAAYESRRCIVPASGFYDWKREGKKMQPYFIHPPAGELFSFAGVTTHMTHSIYFQWVAVLLQQGLQNNLAPPKNAYGVRSVNPWLSPDSWLALLQVHHQFLHRERELHILRPQGRSVETRLAHPRQVG
ncbi:SOS response-associated peptidase [Thauera humireducens]|uniref:SOS response-associated peptidase n=1 Tax=Thauera humireducens TaxID=1134435 RepID=UPI00311FBB09